MMSQELDATKWKIGPGKVVLVFQGGPVDGYACTLDVVSIRGKDTLTGDPEKWGAFLPEGKLQFTHRYSLPLDPKEGRAYSAQYVGARRGD